MVQRPPAGTIPEAPGSYQFKDAHGRVIYVGKAKSLRQRLSNYFQNPRNLHPRTAQMVATAESVEWIQVDNDVEALMLEYSLIKQHQPRFNVRLKDDKSYPFLAVTLDDEWPRATVMRGTKRKGTRYFGPFGHAWAIRDTLDLLLRTFPIRTCSDNKLGRHERLGRPCLLFHIEKCSGPCVGEITKPDYDALVQELVDFLDGDTDTVVHRLEAEMQAASDELEFERAARVRDRLGAVRKAIEKQQMVVEKSEDIDVIGLHGDDLEAAVQVFFVRRGRVVGRKGFVLDKAEDLTEGELVDRILEGLYADPPPLGVPKQVLVPVESADPDLYEELLTHQRGSRVAIRIPQRGDKRELMAMVTRNATEEFTRHRLRRAADHNTRAKALNDLQDHLGLPEAPLRIECYDMSHIQGSDYVGSMVVLEDGLPEEERVPPLQDQGRTGQRRLRRDGGGPHPPPHRLPRRPREARRRSGRPLRLPAAAAARRRRQGPAGRGRAGAGGAGARGGDPGRLAGQALRGGLRAGGERAPHGAPQQRGALPAPAHPRRGPPLRHLVHRELRGKRMTTSVLDGIPGLGETRKKRLVKELGGVGKVKQASLEELKALTWLPDKVAEAVHDKIHAAPTRRG